jgi:phosphatidylglycerol---prolipoprotein diacylglyceryl transferase
MSLHFGGREVGLHTYGILIGCGCALAIAMAHREARRRGMDGGKILDLSFWLLVTGLVGSRILYVALNAGAFVRACTDGGDDFAPRTLGALIGDCTRVLQVWEGGLVFYGGFLAAGLTGYFFARRQRWSFWELGDIYAPALAIGHAVGRLGCYAAGCCFGKACAAGARWCVSFGADSVALDELRAVAAVPAADSHTPPLFPTQLYEAAGELAIFGVLMLLRRRGRGGGGARRPGTLVLVYGALYGLLRFTVEMFRGDFARRFLFQWDTPRLARRLGLPVGEPVLLSTGQAVSVLVALVAVGLLWARARAGGAAGARTGGG